MLFGYSSHRSVTLAESGAKSWAFGHHKVAAAMAISLGSSSPDTLPCGGASGSVLLRASAGATSAQTQHARVSVLFDFGIVGYYTS